MFRVSILLEIVIFILDEFASQSFNSRPVYNTKLLAIVILLAILCCGGCQQITQPPNAHAPSAQIIQPPGAQPPSAQITQSPNAIVAQDGSGNYNTIMAAVLAAPTNSIENYYIQIKEGTYNECVQIEEWQTNIVLIGEGMDKTIILGNKSYGGVNGKGFMAQDITFRNTAGANNQMAAALRATADHCTFYRCQFDGFQDTLYSHVGKQFYRECKILGTIDLICGDAAAVFQNCLIEARLPLPGQYNIITAQQRNAENRTTGFVLQNCTLKLATPDEDNVTVYLGRPWDKFSRTVVMQSYIDVLINPRGWIEFEGLPLVRPFYMEYENRGPGANTNGRVKWALITSDPKIASNFTVRHFINGKEWIPSTVPHYLDLL
ncbi:probable pectinesterase 56 [Lycium barbarum]|uniref:probable pectinesterase 56 n=1 Tax=Lycium barbarum TaxID=112863 RepID=UPI00293F3AAC|nr:probable pectinesterase 56 [Lycium barbarum]